MQSQGKWRGGYGHRQTCGNVVQEPKRCCIVEEPLWHICNNWSLLSDFIVTIKSCSKVCNDGAAGRPVCCTNTTVWVVEVGVCRPSLNLLCGVPILNRAELHSWLLFGSLLDT